jgi:hypothetical protein
MSPADAPRGPVENARPSSRPVGDYARSLTSLIYTQNPFYLLSVAFVLHSTRLWYRQGAGPFDPWPLMALIGGYILLVATTGFVVVRFGKVWDDARSIFLILLLLFVELSLTFDGVVISQPATGRVLLITGLVIAATVSEGLLLGLQIRMPTLYRVPYHLFLSLLFVYPLAIVTGLGDDVSAAVWRVYLYSPVAALVFLTLLPAIRKGPRYIAHTGTPWHWPWFPWGLFGFLAICVGLRAYALSLSFDPALTQKLDEALRLDSAFGTYFLAPLIFAVGLLVLEAGIVAGNQWLQNVGLVIPVISLLLSIPVQQGASVLYVDFLHRFLDRVGSPIWLSSIAAIGFYAIASVRRVKLACELFSGALVIGSCISRATVDFSSLMPPQPWALWLIAAGQGIIGIRRRDSLRVFAAAVCAIAAYRAALPAGTDLVFRAFLPMHAVGLVILIVGAVFDDPFARRLRQAGVLLVVAAAVIAAVDPSPWPTSLPRWSLPVYLAAIAGITFGYAYLVRSRAWFFGGIVGLCLFTGRLLVEATAYLKRLFAWEGAGWFVWGLVWFTVAVLISARKAGLIERMARIIPGADRK